MDLSRLSQNAREVLDVATAVVRRGRSNQLGTEHLLLGLLAQQGGVVHRVFEELRRHPRLPPAQTKHPPKRHELPHPRTRRGGGPNTPPPPPTPPRAPP